MPVSVGMCSMPNVNPDILIWARETAGLTPEDAVLKLGINAARGVAAADRLAALEAGDVAPTRPMLVKMSKRYHRPLLTFYLSNRPRTGDRGEDFRTLPEAFAESETALVDVVVRDIRARQSLVRSLLEEEDEAENLQFVSSLKITAGVNAIVQSIAARLDFDLANYRRQNTIDLAFSYLRAQAESARIFVLLVDNLGSYHTEISVEAFRGFALADDVAPFIAINANDSRGALCFTLVHELAHLWLGLTGVSGRAAVRRVERFCNDVASEFLLPVAELAELNINGHTPVAVAKEQVTAFANARNVSSTMVAYKLQRAGAYDFAYFENLRRTYRQDFLEQRTRIRERGREAEGGPTYPIIRRHRAGAALVTFVDRMLGSGALTTTKAGKVLGVSGKNVQGVLEATRTRQLA